MAVVVNLIHDDVIEAVFSGLVVHQRRPQVEADRVAVLNVRCGLRAVGHERQHGTQTQTRHREKERKRDVLG